MPKDGDIKLFDIDALSVAWVEFNRIAGLKALDSQADYEHARALLVQIVDVAANDATHPLGSLLSLLANLVEGYEKMHYTLGGPEPEAHEMLEFVMQQGRWTLDDMATIADKETLNAILIGEMEIDSALAERLAVFFKLSPKLFLKE